VASNKIAVIGAGAWGTALALQLHSNGNQVLLWGRDDAQISAIQNKRQNERYLPNITLPDELEITNDLVAAASFSQHILMVVPSHSFRAVAQDLKSDMQDVASIIWATKGLELASGKFLHTVLEEEFPNTKTAIISGPSFATEMAAGQPTVMTAASSDATLLDQTVDLFHGKNLRIYSSDDVVGVEIGGAVKNVLAIATGIADGLGYGSNAQAALITRGLAEMVRLGGKLDAKRETLMGVSGVGDLVLTCTDNQSRNRRMGLYLGQGMSVPAATEKIGQAIEGVKTAGVIMDVAKAMQVEMPISEMVSKILYQDKPAKNAVSELLGRKIRAEVE